MTIREVEQCTGLPKQTIRYYEKEGLLHPTRQEGNAYRNFSEEDVRTLKLIKVFRKLDFPLATVKQMLQGETDLQLALEEQIKALQQTAEQLESCIEFCQKLRGEQRIETIDPDRCLAEMERQEKEGHMFYNFLSDTRKMYKAERAKSFSFEPDTMIGNKREFTDALLQYAAENQKEITILKESMYPEFEMEGQVYTAVRYFSRFGAVVTCTLKDPESVEPAEIPKKTRKKYRLAFKVLPIVVIFVVLWAVEAQQMSIGEALGVALTLTVVYYTMWRFTYRR